MRLLRTAIAVALFGVVTAGALSGQEKDKARGQLPQGWGKLNLTAEQKQKVYSIQSKYKQEIERLQKQIEEAKDKQRKDLQAVLTAEQKAKLREMVTGEKTEKK
jgi:Spy/CpxP family protein refolding chaperone